jgi:class 3 adenylate cyclase
VSLDLLRPIAFHGPWLVHGGDDLAWADPALDRGDWSSLAHTEFPDTRDLMPGFADDSFGWYNATLSVVPREGQDVSLSVYALGAWEAFVDGQLVGRSGVVADHFGLVRPGLVRIPEALVQDHEIDVSIRLWSPRIVSGTGGGVYGIGIGDGPALESAADRLLTKKHVDDAPYAFVALFLFLAGLLHLYVWLRRRELREFAILGLGATILGASMGWNFLAYDGIVRPTWGMGLLQAFGFTEGPLLFLLFLNVFFGRATAVPRIILALGVVSCLVGQFVGGAVSAVASYGLVIVPAVVTAVITVVSGLRRRVPGGRAIAAGALWFAFVTTFEDLRGRIYGIPPELEQIHIALAAGAVFGLCLGLMLALGVRFADGLDELEGLLAATRRFVPRAFLQRIGRHDIREVERGDAREREMTILFLDVRSFSTLAEGRTPETMFRFVNDLWATIEPAVVAHGGFVNRFTGDGMLALFDSADDAVRATIDVRKQLDGFDAVPILGVQVQVGLGLHTGTMLLGMVGGSEFLAAGVVADAANLGSRVEGLTKVYGVQALLTGETVRRLQAPASFPLREIDRVAVKGRTTPIDLYELANATHAWAAHYATGLALYRAGRFAEACTELEACRDDPAAAVLAERCKAMDAAPAGWAGVWRMDAK